MEFYKIDDNTIRCIVTAEEMDEYDLTLEMFLTHEGRADEFLHHIMEVASEEVGYESKSPMVSMRLEILPDNRISMTINSHDEEVLRQKLLSRIREMAAQSSFTEYEDPAEELPFEEPKRTGSRSGSGEMLGGRKYSRKAIEQNVPNILVLNFSDLDTVIRYCKAVPVNQPVLSTLVKNEEVYHLILCKHRISLEKYGALAVTALEFADKVEGMDEMPWYASADNSGVLIKDKAFLKLKKF